MVWLARSEAGYTHSSTGRRPLGNLGARAGTIACLLTVVGLLISLPPSSASEPLAQIAFSSGGQIHLANADGGGRLRLTRDAGGVSSAQPAWSPDGTHIAFVRNVVADEDDNRARIWVMGADGSNPHALTPVPPRGVSDLVPAWAPNGQRLAFTRFRQTRGSFSSQIVVIDANGGNERVLVDDAGREDFSQIVGPVWSADGGRILFTRTKLDRRSRFRPSLELVNSDGTGRRTLAPDAAGGSWAPDGVRIAFVSVRDRNGETCGSDECSYNGEIYLMNADGSQARRLTASKADDQGPTWSPDGRRIAFVSNRNFPTRFGGQEVYSMRPDGSCVTWLTNGTPGSFDPAWRPGSGSSDPGGCGATPRQPLVEIDTSAATSFRRHPLYWLGPASTSGLLISHISPGGRSGFSFIYDDCAHYDPAQCPGQVQLQEERTCRGHPFFDLSLRPRIFRRRGALVHIPASREAAVEVYTGRVEIRIFLDRSRDLDGVIAQLRPVIAGERPVERLPRAALPIELWRSLRSAAAAVRRLDSFEAAAKRLRVSRLTVRRRLALLRKLRSIGHVGTLRCRGTARRRG